MSYSARTLVGNWTEERLEPLRPSVIGRYPINVSSSTHSVTSYNVMASNRASFRLKESRPTTNVIFPSEIVIPNRFVSMTQSQFIDPVKAAPPTVHKHHKMSDDELEAYRNMWTKGN